MAQEVQEDRGYRPARDLRDLGVLGRRMGGRRLWSMGLWRVGGGCRRTLLV